MNIVIDSGYFALIAGSNTVYYTTSTWDIDLVGNKIYVRNGYGRCYKLIDSLAQVGTITISGVPTAKPLTMSGLLDLLLLAYAGGDAFVISVNNIVYNYDSENGVTEGVSPDINSWEDQENSIIASQGIDAKKPHLVTLANSKPAVQFNSADDTLASGNHQINGGTNITQLSIIAVIKPQNTNQQQEILGRWGASNPLRSFRFSWIDDAGNIQFVKINAGGAIEILDFSHIHNTDLQVISLIKNGLSVKIKKNNVLVDAEKFLADTNIQDANYSIFIGSNNNANYWSNLQFQRILVALDGNETRVDDTVTNAMSYYGI